MALQAIETPDEICVSVEGELDLTSVEDFKSAVNKALGIREGRRLAIDLSRTDYLDSAGLEQLLAASRKLTAQGDRLVVRVRPNSQPQTVLTVAGFGAVMDIEPALV